MSEIKKPAVKRYFLDTEFCDAGGAGFGIQFISIGLVDEDDGRAFYAVYDSIDVEEMAAAVPWLKQNVLEKLPPKEQWQSLDQIRQGVLDFIEPAEKIEFWTTNGSYDNYILCRLFGGMGKFTGILQKHKGAQRVDFRDLLELRREFGKAAIPDMPEAKKHIAVEDARHDRDKHRWYVQRRGAAASPEAGS